MTHGRLPIVVFGNGACANIGNRYRYLLTEIASHGYLVIATGPIGPADVEWRINLNAPDAPPPAQRPAPSTAAQLTDAIDWAISEQTRPGSDYRGRLDTNAVAVMGQSCGGLQAIAAAFADAGPGPVAAAAPRTMAWSIKCLPIRLFQPAARRPRYVASGAHWRPDG